MDQIEKKEADHEMCNDDQDQKEQIISSEK